MKITKAISIRQPWAYLIINGSKDIENRTWPTKFRGPVFIHAAKKIDMEAYNRLADEGIALPPVKELKTGGIIGTVDIIDCVEKSKSAWFSGPFGFVLRDPKPVRFNECRGFLGFFDVSGESELSKHFAHGETVLVSACLAGVRCRWHGKKSFSSEVRRLMNSRPDLNFVKVCPEQLGGLPTPRPPVKRMRGRVYETCEDKTNRKNVTGADVTAAFAAGATNTLAIAKKHRAKNAVLTKYSPSCDKSGLTGKLLIANQIKVFNTF